MEEEQARILKGLANPKRLKILKLLREKPMTFTEIMRAMGMGSSGELSFHLNKLSGLVEKRGGKYAITDAGVKLLEALESLSREPVTAGIERVPPSRGAKYIIAASLALLLATWLLGLIVIALPEEVYTSTGKLGEYGERYSLLALPLLSTAVVATMTLTFKYRYELMEKIPFLITLPAFATLIHRGELAPRKKGEYINRLFHVQLYVALGVTALLLHMTVMTVLAGLNLVPPEGPAALAMFLPIIIITLALALWIPIYYAKMYDELRERVG